MILNIVSDITLREPSFDCQRLLWWSILDSELMNIANLWQKERKFKETKKWQINLGSGICSLNPKFDIDMLCYIQIWLYIFINCWYDDNDDFHFIEHFQSKTMHALQDLSDRIYIHEICSVTGCMRSSHWQELGNMMWWYLWDSS